MLYVCVGDVMDVVFLLLLFAMIRSVVKSFKFPVVEVAELMNRFNWILPYNLRCQVRRVCAASEQVSHVLW